MQVSDPVADLLTRIRNALIARNSRTNVPASRLKRSILDVLKQRGMIKDYQYTQDDKQGVLDVELAYLPGNRDKVSVIRKLERISKPGRRVYVSSRDIAPVKNGLGVAILSTSKGVLSDEQARAQKLGGELLCRVW